MRELRILVLITLITIIFIPSAFASNVTRYNITNDAEVNTGAPNNNYGSSTGFGVYYAGASYVGSYVELPEAVWEGSSTLYLYPYIAGGQTVVISRTTAFSEDTVTWNNRPSEGSTVTTFNPTVVGAYMPVVLTDPGQYVYIHLLSGNGHSVFTSSEGAESQIPYVTTEVVFTTTLDFYSNFTVDYTVDLDDFDYSYVYMGLYNSFYGEACNVWLTDYSFVLGTLVNVGAGSGSYNYSSLYASYDYPYSACVQVRLFSQPFGPVNVNTELWSFDDTIVYEPPVNITPPEPIPTTTPQPTPDITPPPTPTVNPTPEPDTSPENETSVNNSFSEEYYDYIDGQTEGWNRSILNISGFVSLPIISFRGSVDSINSSLNSTNYTSHMTVLVSIVPFVIGSLPASVRDLIMIALIFIVVLVVLGRDS